MAFAYETRAVFSCHDNLQEPLLSVKGCCVVSQSPAVVATAGGEVVSFINCETKEVLCRYIYCLSSRLSCSITMRPRRVE